jgi:hypothetical protein
MKILKFILNSLNTMLFTVIIIVGATSIINSVLSKDFYLTIQNVSSITIVIGSIVALISSHFYANYYIKSNSNDTEN